MLSTDSAFMSTLCISTLLLILGEGQGTRVGALDPAHQQGNKVINPYLRGMGDPNYQDFYEMPSQFDLGWKRAPSAGFYGMRGKKAPAATNFYGMRGKKGPVGFLGMRGKKNEQGMGGSGWESKEVVGGSEEEKRGRDDVEEAAVSSSSATSWEKREPVPGFMGLRGKRSLGQYSESGRFQTIH